MNMKKMLFSAVLALVSTAAFAQYNVGSSTTSTTDVFSNTVTTHRDANGRVTGTSTIGQIDVFGNTTTTHRNSNGCTTGTSTTGSTDIFGNKKTEQKSNNQNTSIWTW